MVEQPLLALLITILKPILWDNKSNPTILAIVGVARFLNQFSGGSRLTDKKVLINTA
jgi:hypothetical protein